MQDLIIVGASGFGRELLAIVEEINRIELTWNVLGFIDDNLHALDDFETGYRVLGTIIDWKPIGSELYGLAIASPKTKEKVVTILKERGASFATLLAPSVNIGSRSKLGEGVVSFGETGISVDVTVGNFVFFNALCGIGHDAVIGDYCTFGPKVCISGATKMGKCVNVGALASTFPGIEVGDYATIGMNSAVVRKVKANTTVMGVPAKAIL